jgi:hypothetical protein
MSLRDALALKNKVIVVDGTEVTLRRPSVADLVEAVQQSKTSTNFAAWLVFTHLLAENNQPYFINEAEVLGCDGVFVDLLAIEIDKLYGEGRS